MLGGLSCFTVVSMVRTRLFLFNRGGRFFNVRKHNTVRQMRFFARKLLSISFITSKASMSNYCSYRFVCVIIGVSKFVSVRLRSPGNLRLTHPPEIIYQKWPIFGNQGAQVAGPLLMTICSTYIPAKNLNCPTISKDITPNHAKTR